MVASGSRTMIAGSLSSCITGFHQSWRFSQSSGPGRSCVGTGPAFAATGVGSRAHTEGDRRSTRSCAYWSSGSAWRIRFGVRHVFTANCSSSGLRSRSRASPSTWSNGGGRPAAYGAVLRPEGRDGHLELEQKDAWRVFFAPLTCKIRKVKWSRERSPSPHRERGVIASEPRK